MPSSESLISRLIARVKALTSEDWNGVAGGRFRRTVRAISNFAEEHHVTPGEMLDDGVELGRRKVEGLANYEFSAALKNFADAEKSQIEAELLRRSMESDVNRKDADARKAGAEARIAETSALAAELDLIKKLHESGVVLHQDTKGNLTALPLPRGVTLLQLAKMKRLEAENSTPGVITRSDGTHVTKEFRGSIALRDETVIIDPGALVFGDVLALNVEIRPGAVVKGNVYARGTATLRSGSHLEGNVTTSKCSIEDGSYFKGGIDIKKG